VVFVSIVTGAETGLADDAVGEDGKGWELEKMLAGSGEETIAPLLVLAVTERLMALRDALASSKGAVAVPVVLNSRRKKMLS
jgi:hypothetical protein